MVSRIIGGLYVRRELHWQRGLGELLRTVEVCMLDSSRKGDTVLLDWGLVEETEM